MILDNQHEINDSARKTIRNRHEACDIIIAHKHCIKFNGTSYTFSLNDVYIPRMGTPLTDKLPESDLDSISKEVKEEIEEIFEWWKKGDKYLSRRAEDIWNIDLKKYLEDKFQK